MLIVFLHRFYSGMCLSRLDMLSSTTILTSQIFLAPLKTNPFDSRISPFDSSEDESSRIFMLLCSYSQMLLHPKQSSLVQFLLSIQPWSSRSATTEQDVDPEPQPPKTDTGEASH